MSLPKGSINAESDRLEGRREGASSSPLKSPKEGIKMGTTVEDLNYDQDLVGRTLHTTETA